MATVRVKCNGCGTIRQGQPRITLGVLRVALSKVGWRSNDAADRDLCPRCVARLAVAR